MSYHHRLTSKSQVTIPKDVRLALGLAPGGVVDFKIKEGGRVEIVRVDESREAKRIRLMDALLAVSGKFHDGRSTDEKMRELRGNFEL